MADDGPAGISLAFDDTTLAGTPTWTRIDDTANLVASYTIDRGRQFEFERTDGGRATVQINDRHGVLDPTNSSGPYYGKLEPGLQASISRYNPVTGFWRSRFRGYVDDFAYEFDDSQQVNRLTLSLLDIFTILSEIEMLPGQFGDAPPAASAGQVFFDNANGDDRILQILGNAGIDSVFYVVFSLNVGLYESVYSPGEDALSAIAEATDAEFPGVSNAYPDRFGRLAVHGRLAKFDPAGTAAGASAGAWDFTHWKCGDGAAVDLSPSDTAHIREFAFNRGLAQVINNAIATPVNIADADVAGQLVQDLTSIGLRGYQSWTRQNLLTKTGLLDSSDALTETKRFATFYVDNYAEPRNRVTRLAFRPMRPSDTRAAANWDLLTRVDISDLIDVTIGSPGGGGFNAEPFFVEGVHEECVAKITDGGFYEDVTVSLDVSPQAYFTTNPFPTS